MEERLCFTDEMLGVLASLKGKTLKSYEADLGGLNGDVALELVILNTASLRVPVFRVEEGRTMFGEVGEEEAPLECFALDPETPYHYTFENDAKRYLIDERILRVELVRDTGTWEEDGEERVLVEDEAVIVRTSGHAIGLSLEAFADITVRVADRSDADPAEIAISVEERWNMDMVDVEREIIEL